MTDFTREGEWKNILNAASIVRKSSSCVMSATPKTKDRHSKKQQLQILWRKVTSGGGRVSFEKFSPSGREESVGLILVECCGSIGFSTNGRRKPFVDEDLNCKDLKDRCKRQLPTTITLERSNTKKLIGTDGFYGSWHLYICRSLFGHSTFLSSHSCLCKDY